MQRVWDKSFSVSKHVHGFDSVNMGHFDRHTLKQSSRFEVLNEDKTPSINGKTNQYIVTGSYVTYTSSSFLSECVVPVDLL